MALAALSPKAKAETGVEIPICHPETDLPLGIFVTVHGADSEKYKTILRRQTNSRLDKAAKRGGRAKVTAEALDAEGMELLAGCTRSWRTEVREDGKLKEVLEAIELNEGEWLPCTPENVKRVYEELPWLKEQVDQAIGDRTNFLQS